MRLFIQSCFHNLFFRGGGIILFFIEYKYHKIILKGKLKLVLTSWLIVGLNDVRKCMHQKNKKTIPFLNSTDVFSGCKLFCQTFV